MLQPHRNDLFARMYLHFPEVDMVDNTLGSKYGQVRAVGKLVKAPLIPDLNVCAVVLEPNWTLKGLAPIFSVSKRDPKLL